MSAAGTRVRFAVVAGTALTVGLALSGCQQGNDATSSGTRADHAADNRSLGGNDSVAEQEAPPATISSNVGGRGTTVAVDTEVSFDVAGGTFTQVRVVAQDTHKPLRGSFNKAMTQWTADKLLEPGTAYVVQSAVANADGTTASTHRSFRSEKLSLDQQTYASVQPLHNEVVGVGMPVIVQFDIPVTDKATFERHMSVTSTPATVGSWHWVSDQEVHWRPKSYWQSGTRVHVDVDVNGVDAGNGIYGQLSRRVDFRVGRSVVMKANIATDQMKVFLDGSLARTIPVTGGKSGYDTRSGTKLIIEKFASKQMDSATVGIQPGSPEYYNIPAVLYAQRVTFSGEFLHAAPWSTYAQGSYNVSHGCVGMSTDNAAWLYGHTHRGDPVEVTGTHRGLEDNNGWTDWNESFGEYKQASALD